MKRCDGLLVAVLIVAATVRTVAVWTRDLPTGDEINCYIAQAQAFADHGRIAALSDHPGVSLFYGAAIAAIRCIHLTLDGVVAANVFVWVGGVLTAAFVYLALKALHGKGSAFLAAILVAVFPGCYFVLRGDLCLYGLFLSAMLLVLSRLIRQPSWRRALITGLLGASLYLCRSDGLLVVALTLGVTVLVFPTLWRHIALALTAFAMVMACFLFVRYLIMHDVGAGTSTRAFDAFYQAEGLQDGLGGSWQDYTERGLKRFGPPEKYGGSMLRLVLANPGAIGKRIRGNAALVDGYIRKSLGVPSFWLGVCCLGCFFCRKARKAVTVAALPCLLVCSVYFIYYFQESYFVMLSFGLAIASAIGVASFLEFAVIRVAWRRRALVVTVVAGMALACSLGQRTCAPMVRAFGKTMSARCWEALVFLKRSAVNQEATFFAYPYAGSRCMYIYAGGGEPDVTDGDIRGKSAGDIMAVMKAHRVAFVLARKEQDDLWGLSACAETAYANRADDVRVYRVRNLP